ncbi:hypothetical protein ACFRAR_14585 [Kitasatospora sp. NPDC056651]|uniref:DUF7691 family protein n=1 Tax=Kitasatospora sp. NPDC056651 TaxID=3345892 RepID=UPI00368F60DB
MAEQYLSAFAVDGDALLALAGCGDEEFVRRALARIGEPGRREELLRCADAAAVEPVLRELVDGRADLFRPSRYTELLELVAPLVGERLGAAVLPGRGWDGLDGPLRAWGLPALAGRWQLGWTFPWREASGRSRPWPFPVLVTKGELDTVCEELLLFDADRAEDWPGGGDWHGDDLEEAVRLLEECLPPWADGALARGRDLLLLRDGGR